MPDGLTLLDGGMGRELKRRGAPFRQPEWSALALMEAPETVAAVHRAFLEAGAEVITTNSYALVPFHIGEERFALEARQLAALSGELARRTIEDSDSGAKLAGSLPPLFGSYRPDLFEPARAQEILRPLIEGLSPFVDIWLAETLGSLGEAEAVREGLAGDGRPLWLSFTLEDIAADRVERPRLRSGEGIAETVQAANRLEAEALLFNCSQPEVMLPALKIARDTLAGEGAALRLGAYANSFADKTSAEGANANCSALRQDLDADRYLDFARQWVAAGAGIVGGCCGIGPEHIEALSTGLALPGAD